jgi:hypothetical protein
MGEGGAVRFTLISPDEGIKKADEHVLSDSLLETTISGQSTERILQKQQGR